MKGRTQRFPTFSICSWLIGLLTADERSPLAQNVENAFMNMKVKTKRVYEPPRIEVFGIESQGVLCNSDFIGDTGTEEMDVLLFAFP